MGEKTASVRRRSSIGWMGAFVPGIERRGYGREIPLHSPYSLKNTTSELASGSSPVQSKRWYRTPRSTESTPASSRYRLGLSWIGSKFEILDCDRGEDKIRTSAFLSDRLIRLTVSIDRNDVTTYRRSILTDGQLLSIGPIGQRISK